MRWNLSGNNWTLVSSLHGSPRTRLRHAYSETGRPSRRRRNIALEVWTHAVRRRPLRIDQPISRSPVAAIQLPDTRIATRAICERRGSTSAVIRANTVNALSAIPRSISTLLGYFWKGRSVGIAQAGRDQGNHPHTGPYGQWSIQRHERPDQQQACAGRKLVCGSADQPADNATGQPKGRQGK